MARGNVWSGYISFGLINIPIAVQTAEQSNDLSFHMIDKKNLARVKYNRVNAKTGREIKYGDIVKGFEYEKDKYVILSDADFKKANPKASSTLDVHQFVPYNEIDTMLFEKPYYLVPNKGGEKSYFLFQKVLLESEKVALATVVMHGKEHLCCILACQGHLILEMLRFAHEIKHPAAVKDLDRDAKKLKVSPKELQMATKLVEQMSGKWNVEEYKDKYYLDLKKYIDKKIRAGKGKTISEEDEDLEPVSERTIAVKDTDLMALLKQSLGGSAGTRERAKKPKSSPAHRASTRRKGGGGHSPHVH
jgi:DNA end-binding protein Ku